MSRTLTSSKTTVLIDRLSPKGRGLVCEKNLEVIGALPQEEVLIELVRKKRPRLGILRQIITSSLDRVEPRCSHVPHCGGCCLQHMDYSAQLDEKQQIVQKHFSALIAAQHPKIHPIIGCENPWHYRNKMEFSFSENRAEEKFLGLILAGSKGKVLNLNECYLVSEWFMQAMNSVRSWWGNSGLNAYNHKHNTGHLRTLALREAKQGKGKMALLTVSGNPDFALKKQQIEGFVKAVKKTVENDEDLSIFLQIQQIAKGHPTQFFEMHLDGPDHITEILHVEIAGQVYPLQFKISPTSFFQPNTLQAEKLYSLGLQMLQTLRGARVFDLYCGAATIGLSAAKVAREVVGIELNPHAVFDANWNQETNQINNFSIQRGDVAQVLEELQKETNFTPPDIAIVDPPRAGLDPKALLHLKTLGAQEILYISCNPKTQAENIAELIQGGYTLHTIQPIDQFPHTIHIENICYLRRT